MIMNKNYLEDKEYVKSLKVEVMGIVLNFKCMLDYVDSDLIPNATYEDRWEGIERHADLMIKYIKKIYDRSFMSMVTFKTLLFSENDFVDSVFGEDVLKYNIFMGLVQAFFTGEINTSAEVCNVIYTHYNGIVLNNSLDKYRYEDDKVKMIEVYVNTVGLGKEEEEK